MRRPRRSQASSARAAQIAVRGGRTHDPESYPHQERSDLERSRKAAAATVVIAAGCRHARWGNAASVVVMVMAALVMATIAPPTVVAASLIRTPEILGGATPVAALPPPVGMAAPPTTVDSPVPRFDRPDQVAPNFPCHLTPDVAVVVVSGGGIPPRRTLAAVPVAGGGPTGPGRAERGGNCEQRNDRAGSHGGFSFRSRSNLDTSECKADASRGATYAGPPSPGVT